MLPHVRRVSVRNTKSIKRATAALNPFTALVGPNGSGKSNFVDSLAFIRDALSHTLDLAFRDRGGIGAVRRISRGHPNNIEIGLDLLLNRSTRAT